MKKKRNEAAWWKTYDYKSGHTYILAERFVEKGKAMAFAKGCGMIVLPQSTVPISDLERENAILKNQWEALRNEKNNTEQEAGRSTVFSGSGSVCDGGGRSPYEEQAEAAGWLRIPG